MSGEGGEGVPCPACGGREWSTASDGLGDVASVAAVCVSCRYVTTSTIDTTTSSPPNPSTNEGEQHG